MWLKVFEKFDSLAWKSAECGFRVVTFNDRLFELVENTNISTRKKKEIILVNLSDRFVDARFAILMISFEARMIKNEKK